MMQNDRNRVLIIGASGRLGSQLIHDFSKEYEVVGTYFKHKKNRLFYLDVTQTDQVKQIIERENPHIIIIASAQTHVEKCESDPEGTFKVNVEGVRNIVDNCKDQKVIFLSTDSIFDGIKEEYYEDDQPHPINVYGQSKLEGERVVQNLQNYIICRTARLYGKEKKNPKFINFVINDLRDNREVQAPIDSMGNATFIPDLSCALLQLLKKEKKGVYHVTSPDSYSLYDTAVKIAEVFGFKKTIIKPVDKNFFNTKVKRPNSILNTNKLKKEGIFMSSLEQGLQKVKTHQDKYEDLHVCRICGNTELICYLDLGETPLANSFIEKNALQHEQEQFSLRVVLCNQCCLSQLDIVVSHQHLFNSYVYRSSISHSFQKHCRELAEELSHSYIIDQDFLVLDIASNDGTLLKEFKDKSKILGVEPAANIAKIANESQIKTINQFWSPELAQEIVKDFGHAKIITAFNVFAHVHDIHAFVRGVKTLLRDDGYFIAEFPHLLKLIKNIEFDTVYHEHLSYFLVKPLIKLFEMHDMKIAKIKEFDIHGGSLRLYITHKNHFCEDDGSVNKVLSDEESLGLFGIEAYLHFSKEVEKIADELRRTVQKLNKEGKVVCGFGASAKGNTLLNYSRINNRLIDCILDATPEKQGKLTPGTHIPIFNSDILMKKKPDYLLLLAWNFSKEIMEKTSDYKAQGGKYIIPVPYVQTI